MAVTRKRGNCECIESARTTPAPSRFNYDELRRHAKFEVAGPIYYHIKPIAFLLRIHYFTLWPLPLIPWPLCLTLNFYSTLGVVRLNSVQNLSEME